MKISQMTTDQAADALVRMAEPISNIMSDEEAVPMLEALFAEVNTEKPIEGLAAVLMKLVPFCLKKHRKDLYTIIAALDGKDEKNVGKFSFMSTLRVLRDSMDQELVDFFRSSGAAQPSAGEKSAQ